MKKQNNLQCICTKQHSFKRLDTKADSTKEKADESMGLAGDFSSFLSATEKEQTGHQYITDIHRTLHSET